MGRLSACLIAIVLVIGSVPAARCQERPYLMRDYAWRDYYEQQHDEKAMHAEEARIAQEQAALEKMRNIQKGHDYSSHQTYPPGWPRQ